MALRHLDVSGWRFYFRLVERFFKFWCVGRCPDGRTTRIQLAQRDFEQKHHQAKDAHTASFAFFFAIRSLGRRVGQ